MDQLVGVLPGVEVGLKATPELHPDLVVARVAHLVGEPRYTLLDEAMLAQYANRLPG